MSQSLAAFRLARLIALLLVLVSGSVLVRAPKGASALWVVGSLICVCAAAFLVHHARRSLDRAVSREMRRRGGAVWLRQPDLVDTAVALAADEGRTFAEEPGVEQVDESVSAALPPSPGPVNGPSPITPADARSDHDQRRH